MTDRTYTATEVEAHIGAVLEDALTRISQASDYYANEREATNRGAETLAYAHSSTCRLARAALEGEK